MRRALLAPVFLAALSASALADMADELEARSAKDVEEATELLSKVQSGQMEYAKAAAELQKFLQRVDEFDEVASKRAEKYAAELQSIWYWVRKFAPLEKPAAKPSEGGESKTPGGENPAKPDEKPVEPAVPPPPPPPADFAPPPLPEEPEARATALLPLLSSPDPKARAWAAGETAPLARPNLLDAVLGLAMNDADFAVQEAAANAVLRTRSPHVFTAFLREAKKAEGAALDRLVTLVKGKPDKHCVAALFEVAMRFTPPIGGAPSQSKPAMEDYKQRAKAAWQDGWRNRVIQIWQSWPEPVVSAGLGLTWKGSNTREKQEILLAVGVVGNARGIRHAVPFLTKGPETPFRAPALAAIEMVGKGSVPWLAQGLANGATQLWCFQALRNITGEKTLDAKPSQWIRWWNENR
ncbi:MAG: hypothetical protein L0216_09725 [Planctomycetales bacterium]|nr:hypothetical protein [Planctomycetales bacterium]